MSEGATSQNVSTFGAIEAIERGLGASDEASVMRRSGRRREDRIVAASGAAQRAIDRAILAARSSQPVIVSGAPGTGKSMLARAIHAWSADATAPLETLVCPAVPEPLQARELFGGVAGTYPALPGAFAGAIERATGGTLLLEGLDALAPQFNRALGFLLCLGQHPVALGQHLLRLLDLFGDGHPQLVDQFEEAILVDDGVVGEWEMTAAVEQLLQPIDEVKDVHGCLRPGGVTASGFDWRSMRRGDCLYPRAGARSRPATIAASVH